MKNPTKAERKFRLFSRLGELGFSYDECHALYRIEMCLQRWYEQECGNSDNYKSWSIERDEESDKPYMVIHPYNGKTYRYAIADREKGAIKRLDAIMTGKPSLWYYIQTDPRGCALYIGKKADMPLPIDANYNRGIAVCI